MSLRGDVMFLGFRIKNFMSIKEETYIDFRADTSILEHDYVLHDAHGVKVLPIVSIYGANASGKSNVIKAYTVFVKCLQSADITNSTDINIQPFLFDKNTDDASEFEAYFYYDSNEYRYGFSIKDKCIIDEWLFDRTFSNDTTVKWKLIFERNKGTVVYNEEYEHLNVFNNYVTNNILMLRFFGKLDISGMGKLMKLYEILAEFMFSVQSSAIDIGLLNTVSNAYMSNPKLCYDMVEYLKQVDPTIDDLIIAFDKSMQQNMIYFIRNNVKLSFWMESDGTKKIYSLFGLIANSLANGCLAVIDELDCQLHPLLFKKIVRMFNDKTINTNNAQLMFTSHDVIMLNSRDLRRDEIWFTEKDADGGTELFSLADFDRKTTEADAEYGKNYLFGIFGAVPFSEMRSEA